MMEDAADMADVADVLVVGAGPAGLAVAAACGAEGLDTVLLDPARDRPWPHTYGAWVDEVPADLRPSLSHRWTDVGFVTDAGRVPLGREYGLFDNAGLRAALAGRFTAAGGRRRTGRATGWRRAGSGEGTDGRDAGLDVDVASAPPGSGATAGGGRATIRARAVVDASGHRPALLPRPAGRVPAQTAYGIIGRFARPPAPGGGMTLMDFSTDWAPGGRWHGGRGAAPSFLYAMDLGDGRWLAEETSLSALPPMEIATLAERLTRRLARRGAAPVDIGRIERVHIPMGVPIPDRTHPVIGFGAAAGMVHPATGYQVARSLTLAPRLATALRWGLHDGAGTAALARVGWAAVWPPEAVTQRHLHDVGLRALLDMDAAEVQRFFTAFFASGDGWPEYLSHGGTRGVLATMGGVFARVPWRLRARLAAAAGGYAAEWSASAIRAARSR